MQSSAALFYPALSMDTFRRVNVLVAMGFVSACIVLAMPGDSDALPLCGAGPSEESVVGGLRLQSEGSPERKERWGVALRLYKLDSERSQEYLDHLLEGATDVLEADAPFPWYLAGDEYFDAAAGDAYIPGEFLQWVTDQELDLENARDRVLFEDPVPFLYIAQIGDPDGIHVLDKALGSKNPYIVIYAVRGLARLRADDRLDRIEEVVRKFPSGIQEGFVSELLLFGTKKADSLAASLVSDHPDLRRHVQDRIKKRDRR